MPPSSVGYNQVSLTGVTQTYQLSSTHQAFVDECRHLKSMFHYLGYPRSMVYCIIDKCDHYSTLDAKTQSDETLRVSISSIDQVSANMVKRRMRDLRSKIVIDVQPIYTSKKLEQDLKLKEIKPGIVNQHSIVWFVCTSDIRCAICFNALLIIDILPLVAIWEMVMGTLTYSMRASLEC